MATKVLIVEDEIMAQKSLIRVLTQHFPDMQVVGTTTSVKSTVAWLKEPANSADIIFMDVEQVENCSELKISFYLCCFYMYSILLAIFQFSEAESI